MFFHLKNIFKKTLPPKLLSEGLFPTHAFKGKYSNHSNEDKENRYHRFSRRSKEKRAESLYKDIMTKIHKVGEANEDPDPENSKELKMNIKRPSLRHNRLSNAKYKEFLKCKKKTPLTKESLEDSISGFPSSNISDQYRVEWYIQSAESKSKSAIQ